MKVFFLRRLTGLAYLVDGLIIFFTPFNAGLALKAARTLANARYKRQWEKK